MDRIRHITQSIANAIEGKSNLIPEIMTINGMSSIKNRHLLNNILNIPDVNYLEIGVHQGSTFISSLYGNKVNSAYAIDDWSQFNDRDIKTLFMGNCNKFNVGDFEFFEKDCFDVDLNCFKNKINIYFYDGHHSVDNSRKALTYFYNILADEFIFIADDINWPCVLEGVNLGITENELKVVFDCRLFDDFTNDNEGWWNGFYVAIFKKTKNG